MRRVFIQAYCSYPHSGALANYIENLGKAIDHAGYEVILITDISKEYDGCSAFSSQKFVHVEPVMPVEDGDKRQEQRRTGYCRERMGVLKAFAITAADKVVVLGIRNEFFMENLFAYRDKVGFKVICGVLELFTEEHYKTSEQYQDYIHIRDELYLRGDAILTVSNYIAQYYAGKGMSVHLLPPIIDFCDYEVKSKEMDKRRFIIPSQKDSLRAMVKAFCGLRRQETERLELHLCMVKEEAVRVMAEEQEWEKLMQYTVIHEWMSYEELKRLYQQMHFLVIARDVCQRTLANFPSKVPECMAMGIVPIVSDVGDYTKYYLSKGKDSIYMNGDSVEEIRHAVRLALSYTWETYERYSENARHTAKERFDFHGWTAKIREMVES